MDISVILNEYTKKDAFYNRKAVRAVIYNGSRFLLIKGKYGDYKFPGGGMENGESREAALIREIKEETGYETVRSSITKFGTAREKRILDNDEITVMESDYYNCDIYMHKSDGMLSDTDNSDANMPDAVWIHLEEALEANRAITDYEECPWVIRDTRVMEYLISERERRVNIFNRFRCMGTECEITCCREWKISVDKDTSRRWKNNPDMPSKCTKTADGTEVIRLDDSRHCPFLTGEGLCSLVIRYGEDYISETCRIFPRQFNVFDDRTECSLVSSCPHVVDIINEAEAIKINRSGNTGLFAVRDKITDFFSSDELTFQEAALLSYFYLMEEDFDKEEILHAVKNIINNPVNTFEECNELFLDITVNYVKEGMYDEFLTEICRTAENTGFNTGMILDFLKMFSRYDNLMKKFIVSEVIANLYLSDYDRKDMTIALEWIIMEYAVIRQGCFLLWKNKGSLLYNDVRLCITIVSRMMGYDEPDIREYMENSFDKAVFEPAYLALVTGGTNETFIDA